MNRDNAKPMSLMLLGDVIHKKSCCKVALNGLMKALRDRF